MEIGKDCFVVLEYTLRLQDGTYLKGDPNEGFASLNFVVGYNQLLPALEQRLLGLEEGAESAFVITANEAFGDRHSHLIQERTYEEFPQGRELEAGKWVVATHQDSRAQYSYFVQSKTADKVTLDFNHPLAGKDLHYHVKIVKVRPASADELSEIRPCEFKPEGNAATH